MKSLIFVLASFYVGIVNAGCFLNIEIPKGCDVESIRKQVPPNVSVKALIPGNGEIMILNIVSKNDLAKKKQDFVVGQFSGRLGRDGYYNIKAGGPNQCGAYFKMDDSGPVLKISGANLNATGGVSAKTACTKLGDFMGAILDETWYVVPE
ncbi:MAG: hypothetical protein FGM17_06315 [Polynucleobacter sp.]|uniref:hypothetical protein n=1 Tax=Polynucleobacter sp. TaxID=2029855 RepID=UPI00216BD823|nr:hypothetical protein [Polynucleobacter sp.]MBU3670316.1 hypothetical protein [Polynucleobacter sp.]